MNRLRLALCAAPRHRTHPKRGFRRVLAAMFKTQKRIHAKPPTEAKHTPHPPPPNSGQQPFPPQLPRSSSAQRPEARHPARASPPSQAGFMLCGTSLSPAHLTLTRQQQILGIYPAWAGQLPSASGRDPFPAPAPLRLCSRSSSAFPKPGLQSPRTPYSKNLLFLPEPRLSILHRL